MFKICQKLVESKYIVFFIEEIYLKALVKNAYFFFCIPVNNCMLKVTDRNTTTTGTTELYNLARRPYF